MENNRRNMGQRRFDEERRRLDEDRRRFDEERRRFDEDRRRFDEGMRFDADGRWVFSMRDSEECICRRRER